MTGYHVEWTEVAAAQLTELWLGSRQRQHISEAVDEIDTFLRRWPSRRAYHISEGLFQLEVAPLRVYFYVEESAKLVTIDAVKLLT